jgi:hypothetical protein
MVRNLWLTCDQFLACHAGDAQQHAVLLANYLLYLAGVSSQQEEDTSKKKVSKMMKEPLCLNHK